MAILRSEQNELLTHLFKKNGIFVDPKTLVVCDRVRWGVSKTSPALMKLEHRFHHSK